MFNNLNKKIFIVIILFFGILSLWLFFLEFKNIEPIETTIVPTITPVKVQTKEASGITGIGITTEEFKQGQLEFVKDHPILQKLPFGNPYFNVEYISETHLIVHAKTEDKEGDYEEAKNWFIENDIDTANILIEYK